MPKNVGEVEYAAGVVLAGKYRIERRLGGGAMGTVYEVTQTDLERTCAVKVMKASLARDAAMVARFRAEAQTHSLLEGSAHICTVFDFGSLDDENGTPFYAMTLLRGRPLSELIHYYYAIKQRRFPPKIALAIAHQICKALAFAHERGVVHCDIKPENLFVHVLGQTWWVLVVDFGIAHRVASTVRADDLFIGTPPFSPREQVLGRQPSPKMDIHAVGVVLFILLTGRAPYAHLGASGLAAVLSARPPAAPLISQFGDYPRELTALIARCLSHNADERPDARYLAARFHDLANELPESGSRPDESAKHPALTAPITPSETPLAISRWQQDQDKWDRTQRRLQRRESLRRLGKRTGVTLAIAFGVAGASSTGVLLLRKPAAPPPSPHASPASEIQTAPSTLAPAQITAPAPQEPQEKAPAEPIPAASASQHPAPKPSAPRSSPEMAPPPRLRAPANANAGQKEQKETGRPGDLETTID